PLCWLLKMFSKNVILNVDGADSEREKWTGLAKRYLRWSERVACKVADVIVADSHVIERRYRKVYNRQTNYFPYGSNLYQRESYQSEVADNFLNRWGLERDKYILFVSRMTPENRADVLIEAFRKVNTKLKLAIVGDANYVDDYRKKIFDLCDKTENVVRLGYQFDNAYRILSANCCYFVLPSGVDGTRAVLLDQRGYGNCVVVCNTQAHMEVIDESGLSFSNEDRISALTDVIEGLEDNQDAISHYRERA